MSYVSIQNFGRSPPAQANPLSYCFVSAFDAGSHHIIGGTNFLSAKNKNCQLFSSAYCAKNWDALCEKESQNQQTYAMNTINYNSDYCPNLTRGEILIRNTAFEKYLVEMSSNCVRTYEPFDPTTGDSILISTWTSTDNEGCFPVFDVNPENLDNDRVMNLILERPHIALDILVNIHSTNVKNNTLEKLKGTKLYDFFNSEYYKNISSRKAPIQPQCNRRR